MQFTRSRGLVLAVLIALGVLLPVAPAGAAEPWMAWNGDSVNGASVPAEQTAITTVTTVAHDSGTYLLDGAVRGRITQVARVGAEYRGAGTVDLRGLSGTITLTAKLYRAGRVVQTVYKPFRVAPLEAGIPDGYPDADSTGVEAGTRLTRRGSLTVTRPGTVVENLDIRGCLTVTAPDVTVRNTRIRCSGAPLAVNLRGAKGFLMEDSEIDGRGSTVVAIGWSGYTLRRVDIHSTFDGPRLGDGVRIEDSYVHSLVKDAGVHTDATQSTSGVGIVVRGNTFTPDPENGTESANSAVQLGTELGQRRLRNAVFEDNYFDGGGYTVNVRCEADIAGLVFRDNEFGHGAEHGPVLAPSDVRFAGNTFADSGEPVPVHRCD